MFSLKTATAAEFPLPLSRACLETLVSRKLYKSICQFSEKTLQPEGSNYPISFIWWYWDNRGCSAHMAGLEAHRPCMSESSLVPCTTSRQMAWCPFILRLTTEQAGGEESPGWYPSRLCRDWPEQFTEERTRVHTAYGSQAGCINLTLGPNAR